MVLYGIIQNRIADCHHVVKQTPPPSYYQQLIEEINKLGWDRCVLWKVLKITNLITL